MGSAILPIAARVVWQCLFVAQMASSAPNPACMHRIRCCRLKRRQRHKNELTLGCRDRRFHGVFERKPAPDLIPGGSRFALRKRVTNGDTGERLRPAAGLSEK